MEERPLVQFVTHRSSVGDETAPGSTEIGHEDPAAHIEPPSIVRSRPVDDWVRVSEPTDTVEHMIESHVMDAAQLAVLTRRRAVAEAREWRGMLRYAHQRETQISQTASSPMHAVVSRSMVATEIAAATGLSEAQVQSRLAIAENISAHAPNTWTAFQAGLVDAARLRDISSAVDQLTRPESLIKLDQKVVDYAGDHTPAELRRWLSRFIRRVETDQALERAESERTKRHVRIDHDNNGMSHLYAYLPSMMAAAIERRLHHDSRSLENDGRTQDQKKADLLVSWATSNEAGQPAPHTDIAVTVPADVLSGATTGHAASADGAWTVPSTWMKELINTGNTFWWRMLHDPITHDILTIEYQGRFAPDLLKRAILFRDGVCAHPGCLVPAWACDLDHIRPWPDGPTTASNIEPRSRRHHAQKGHGLAPPRRHTPHEAFLHDLVLEHTGLAA